MSDSKRLARRITRLQKHPPATPVVLGPIEGDIIKVAYRATDGTLGVSLFKNTHVFCGVVPKHVEAYIRAVTASHPDDRSEGRRHVTASGLDPTSPAPAAAATDRPSSDEAR